MAEIKMNDMQEIKNPAVDNFQTIGPENGMTFQEASDYWSQQFSKDDYANEIKKSEAIQADDLGEDNREVSENPRYIITLNESLENDRHPITGVEFKCKTIELPDGEKVEGVFPEFESEFEVQLPQEMYLKTDKQQFKECNKRLAEAIENDPKLKEKFSAEQIEQIHDGVYDGTSPDGYVWHHDAEPGKMQLVDCETHSHTGHTGGRSLWGGGSDFR